MNKKIFIIRKYIVARSIGEALRLEKKKPADDCWLDEDFHKAEVYEEFRKKGNVGFKKTK